MSYKEYFLFAFLLQMLLSLVYAGASCNGDCGFNSECTNGVCRCKSGHSSNENGTNCADDLCGDGQCYECHDRNKCKRCKAIVVEGTGKCVTSCSTATTLKLSGEYTGKVCKEDEKSLKMEHIVLIASISGVFVLVVVIAVAIYVRTLTDSGFSDAELPASATNGSIALTHQLLKTDRPTVLRSAEDIVNMEPRKKVNRGTSFKAMVYSPSQKSIEDARKESKQIVLKKLSSLKPDAETFLEMLNDLRGRLQLLQENQVPGPQYRSMIHDLSRILFLLNKNGEDFEIPPDGALLLDWGEHVLRAYQEHNAVTETTPPSTATSTPTPPLSDKTL